MWFNLSDADVAVIRDAHATAKVATGGLVTCSHLLERIAAFKTEQAELSAYREGVEGDDEMEIDADAVVSLGGDPGAWVMAWVWVTNEQAGIETEDEEAA